MKNRKYDKQNEKNMKQEEEKRKKKKREKDKMSHAWSASLHAKSREIPPTSHPLTSTVLRTIYTHIHTDTDAHVCVLQYACDKRAYIHKTLRVGRHAAHHALPLNPKP